MSPSLSIINMKALLVIDIQKSYISRYNHNLLSKINERILEAEKNHWDIVYIKNIKRLRNRTLTEEFADGLAVLSDNVFCKNEANAFSSLNLLSFLQSKSIKELEILGVDGNSCIKASVKGAIDCGFSVMVPLDSIGVINQNRFENTKDLFTKLGVIFL